eukprot:TRINITY_DN9200_c0_g1_i1.p1 TRINITY_DN9200_c0_g1~~TRINITY_DN9200_c0_g1_i1.p1  ORF type:complete len:78 (+),score=12.54 TRINITY_DN9200_c0_g1_i1:135-368(+)
MFRLYSALSCFFRFSSSSSASPSHEYHLSLDLPKELCILLFAFSDLLIKSSDVALVSSSSFCHFHGRSSETAKAHRG